MLLIGSRALKYHYPDAREPKDYDFIATEQEVNSFLGKFEYKDNSTHYKKRRTIINLNGKKISFEFDLIEHTPSSNEIYAEEMMDKNNFVYDQNLTIGYHVACPEILLTIKKSHITFPIHWWKNIYDYHFLLDKLKPSLIYLAYDNLFKMRYQEIKSRINKKEIKFDLSNQEFFEKSSKKIKRIVDHDSLHRSIAFYDEPLFLMAKEDLNRAELSEELFEMMSHQNKIQMIQEEAMALALEREIIPALIKKEKFNEKLSYARYAGKMVYHYLPEWLRLFAADNFLEILDLKKDYVEECLKNHPTLKKMIV